MLNLKKLLTKILEQIAEAQTTPQIIQLSGQPLNGTFSVSPKPYDRRALIVPNFASINTFSYNLKLSGIIRAGATSGSLTNMFKNDGTVVSDSTKVDVYLILFRI